MAKTTADASDLDAAIAELRRQLAALERLQRARKISEDRQAIQRELARRAREHLEAAETEARESGALDFMAALRKSTTPP
jgi:hypothetical protein